jgi:hypothetical protein
MATVRFGYSGQLVFPQCAGIADVRSILHIPLAEESLSSFFLRALYYRSLDATGRVLRLSRT